MRKHHPRNERIKRCYLSYLEEASRMSPKSTDQIAAAIAQFEASTGYKDFARFHVEQAKRFKRQLSEHAISGKPLAKATIHSRLMAVKAFFHWLAGQPGYKSRINYSDSDYFNPSANDGRIALARRERPVPSVEQIRHVINSMRAESDLEKRNRALIAFAFLTGVRDDALASLSVGHVDLEKRSVFQDARTVRTKFRKTFNSCFFPVGDDIEAIVADWVGFLRSERLFGPDDPLFPATKIDLDAVGRFSPAGLERKHWKNADAIRRIFRESFQGCGLPYFNPHSFRKTLAQLGEQQCRSAEEFKAWSQNLGHDNVLTTLTSYGEVASHRQVQIFVEFRRTASLRPDANAPPDTATIQRVLEHLSARVR